MPTPNSKRKEPLRNLIDQYGIQFEGPIRPTTWPRRYRSIFQKIRDIGRTLYDESGPNEPPGLLTRPEEKKRVRSLVRTAYECRRLRFNEPSWRGATEPKIVSRLADEVICETCSDRLWISKFQAVPEDHLEAERLRKRRAKRKLCECDDASRANEDSGNPGQIAMFSSRSEYQVLHDPDDELVEKGVHVRKPDLLFGLGMTSSFKRATSLNSNRRHSPIADAHLLYPFLILEAKSEKGSPGFESVETQTAFPIRTCVKLQSDLQREAQLDLAPLVWFLANQGDEWRVYACIAEHPKTRIIDLWHGSILSHDSALQLLQIMDYICDWARDMYRPKVFQCLAGRELDLRDLTPGWSASSTQMDDSENVQSSSTCTTPGPSSPGMSPLIDLTFEDVVMEEASPNRPDSRFLDSTNLSESQLVVDSITDPGGSALFNNNIAIQHSDLVRFVFLHIALPEEHDTLVEYLTRTGANVDIASAAADILRSMKTSGILITDDGVAQLEIFWTQTERSTMPESDEPRLALICFKTCFGPTDWRILRFLTCITCSLRALEVITELAGADSWLDRRAINWTAHRCPCLISTARYVRSLCGKDSIAGAAGWLSLVLQTDLQESEGHFRWLVLPASDRRQPFTNNSDCTIWERLLTNPSLNMQSSTKSVRLLGGKPTSTELSSLIRSPSGVVSDDGVLLSKELQWPWSHQRFCLFIMDETNLKSEAALARKLRRVVEKGQLYGSDFTDDRDGTTVAAHLTLLRQWFDMLDDGRAVSEMKMAQKGTFAVE